MFLNYMNVPNIKIKKTPTRVYSFGFVIGLRSYTRPAVRFTDDTDP